MVYHPHTDALKFVIPIIYSYIFLRTGVTFGRDFFFSHLLSFFNNVGPLENPIDRGAWRATVHGVTKSWTQLSDFH